MRARGRSTYGRTLKVGVAGVAATLLTFAVTSPGSATPAQDSAATPFNNGSGNAIALVYKVNPVFGNLSFGITAGESVAGHQNTGATGQSQSIDLGVIGVTLAGAGCDGADPTLPADKQPQAVVVRSDDPGADKGKTAKEGGVITQFASATTKPLATASTEIGPIGEQNGLFLSGGKAVATSGIVQAGVRQATATTDIGKVSLLGGLVTLNGLHWNAVQETGGRTTNTGTFTLGSISVLGLTLKPDPDALNQLDSAQDFLSSIGITISRPQTRVASGVVFVDPLRIGIVPSKLRDTLIATLLGQLQTVRQTLTDAIAAISCDGQLNVLGNNGSTLVTVLDLGLATVSGAGSLTVELGGVQATTAAINQFQGLGDIPALDTGSTDSSSSSTDLPDLGSTDGTDLGLGTDVGATTGGGTAPTGGSTGGTSGATKPIADINGSRGGTLAAVGAAGLLLLLATAEADRRKMRRAQREIPMED
jgi:hypothetical protein